jgi:hypothetical protein
MSTGYIKIYRDIRDWEWFTSNSHYVLFTKILYIVNYEDKKWQNLTIKRGQFVSSTKNLATYANLSESTVKRVLNDFEESGEISREPTKFYTVYTINKFNEWQSSLTQLKEPSKDLTHLKEPHAEPSNEPPIEPQLKKLTSKEVVVGLNEDQVKGNGEWNKEDKSIFFRNGRFECTKKYINYLKQKYPTLNVIEIFTEFSNKTKDNYKDINNPSSYFEGILKRKLNNGKN